MHIFIISLFILFQSGTVQLSENTDIDQIKAMIINGERAEAIKTLEQVVRDDPSEQELSLLIDLYHQTFSFSRLIDLFLSHERVLDQNPAVLFAYAQAKHQTGFENRAVQILEAQRQLDLRDDVRGPILLGRIYDNNENWEAAEPVYRQLTEMAPENLHFRTRLAKVNANLRETDYARQLLRDVLKEDPEYLPAILELSIIHVAENELHKARERIDPALRIYPEQARLWDLSARIAYSLQQFETAIEHWGKLIDLNEADFSTFRGRGLSFYQLGNADKALENFNSVLGLNPADKVSLFYSAMVYRQIEDWKKAEELLNTLYDLHITDYFTDTIMQRAVVSEELDNIESAKRDYRLVKMIEPGHKSAGFYLAGLYDRHSDDHERIIEHYLNYLEMDNPDPSLEEYARSRVGVLRERLHFSRGRE